LSTALLAVHTLTVPEYFAQPYQLFPLWPEWRPDWALQLVGATAFLLFVPKILATMLAMRDHSRAYGGARALWASLAIESMLSMLLAPIRMLFHTQFVTMALAGRSVRWKSPPRGDNETGWSHALARHGWQTLVGIAWAALVWWLNPSYLWWLAPVVGALILSIPLSVLTSRTGLGRKLRRRKYFLLPEESHPPPVIRATRRYWHHAPRPADFETAVVDPITNALVCAQAVGRSATGWPRGAIADALVDPALRQGAGALAAKDRNRLLADPAALSMLHWVVWTSPHAHASWRALIASVAARPRSLLGREDAAAPAVAAPSVVVSDIASG